ncbi:hypothetical protein NNJEOMEG_02513 [Fundidesulfovibrio magnetotacticus]|uniref:NfeD-like C-terminal domain-containing protein n=1 Tax=Fundidesulfovibrio magnetotacticus TaxID=2730080 RepID=A0A6V8LXX5_9BACT|nr:NfeD family protein [Fundidesulfovibrio magnetotacticus]GFK94666.1 hypothetical protein NNJEOMEG_02513 [Fundidesulfovibrio magnetotacticus]
MTWNAPVIWTLAGLALIVLEAFLPGLVVLFFGLGALAAALAAWLFDPSLSVQFLVFTGASLASLALLRRRFAQAFQGRVGAGDARVEAIDSLVGEDGVVSEAVPAGGLGRVKVRGSFYAARSAQALAAGAPVRVTDDPRGDRSILTVEGKV